MMEKIARKKIIIFTPNGFLRQEEHDNNPWQVHKSGWNINEMKSLGYNVIGINGLKFLKGERAEIKFKPRIFWSLISDITQLFTRKHPKYAFQILCTKEASSLSLLGKASGENKENLQEEKRK